MHQKAIEQEEPNILITDLAGEGKIDASVGCWIDEKPWFFGNPSKFIDCWRWTSGKTAIDPFLMHSWLLSAATHARGVISITGSDEGETQWFMIALAPNTPSIETWRGFDDFQFPLNLPLTVETFLR